MLSAHCSDKFLDNNSDLIIDNFLQAHKAIKIHQVKITIVCLISACLGSAQTCPEEQQHKL